MKSITVHNLDDSLAAVLRHKARQDGSSLNRTIKRLLALAVGLKGEKPVARGDFKRFCGAWNGKEALEFSAAMKSFERFDKADWQ
jgi:hypothetical protein